MSNKIAGVVLGSLTCEFDIELRGQTVNVECVADPPDHSVGIMGWGCAEWVIREGDCGGKELDWCLTEGEIDKLNAKVSEMAWDGYFELDPELNY